jgi:hypothetical protein
MGDQPDARPLPKHRTTQTQNKHKQTPNIMPCVGFEPMILASEQAKTVHALGRSATVTGWIYTCSPPYVFMVMSLIS